MWWNLALLSALVAIALGGGPEKRGRQTDCVDCRFSGDNRMYVTNNRSEFVYSLRCDDGPGQMALCQNPQSRNMTSFVPQSSLLCDEPKVVCYHPESVTAWSDERLSANYETGNVPANPNADRDMWPEDYRGFASRSSYVPRNPRARLGGEPDIYAYEGSSFLSSLFAEVDSRIPLPGTLTERPSGTSYDSVPPYENPNKKLFIYAGQTASPNDWNNYLVSNACDRRCAFGQIYNYLANHRGVKQNFMQGMRVLTNLVPVGYNASQRADLLQLMRTEFHCTNERDCFQNLTMVNFNLGHVRPANRSFLSCAVSTFRQAYAHECRLGNAEGRAVALPTITGGNQVLRMESYFYGPDGKMLQYPFTMFQAWSRQVGLFAGRTTFFEQSEDGHNWTPFADSISNETYQALMNGDDRLALLGSGSNPCDRSANLVCYFPTGVTGKGRHLRLVTLVSHGGNARPAGMTIDNQGVTRVPPYLWAAEQRAPVDVYVTPSLHATLNQSDDFDVCNSIPGCRFIPATYGHVHPTNPVVVKNFMRERVVSEVWGCDRRQSPVEQFIRGDFNGTQMDRCDRTSHSEQTCYRFSSDFSTPSTRLTVRHEGSRTIYRKDTRVLTVYRMPWRRNFPQPALGIGRITPASPHPLYYVYTTARPGMYSFRGLYISTGPICGAAAATPTTATPTTTHMATASSSSGSRPLPESNNCTCSDVLVGGYCLCADQVAFRARNSGQAAANETQPQDVAAHHPVRYLRGTQPRFWHLSARVMTVFDRSAIDCRQVICGQGQTYCKDMVYKLTGCEELLDKIQRSVYQTNMLRTAILGKYAGLDGRLDYSYRNLSELIPDEEQTDAGEWGSGECGFSGLGDRTVRTGGKVTVREGSRYRHLRLMRANATVDRSGNQGAVFAAENFNRESSTFCGQGLLGLELFAIQAHRMEQAHREFYGELTSYPELGALGIRAQSNEVLSLGKMAFMPVRQVSNISNVICNEGYLLSAQVGWVFIHDNGTWMITNEMILNPINHDNTTTTLLGRCAGMDVGTTPTPMLGDPMTTTRASPTTHRATTRRMTAHRATTQTSATHAPTTTTTHTTTSPAPPPAPPATLGPTTDPRVSDSQLQLFILLTSIIYPLFIMFNSVFVIILMISVFGGTGSRYYQIA